ncbi:MAG TPA: hypothetical protein VG873_15825 [Burkholderiales bacterium]|nr:hypothetical protein [Burkholderiales bacterium]
MRHSIAALLLCVAVSAHAQPQEREYIYGAELMTPEEREQYRKDAQAAKDDAARTGLRERHRTRLRERARQRGVQLREPHGIVAPARGN